MKKILMLAAIFCVLRAGGARAEVVPKGLAIVGDHASVCMVTDHYMGTPQIPVQAEGKTYYGCCQMCAGTIQNNSGVRHAADPVTGVKVDKAQAVIAKDGAGKVYYFESEKTYQTFLGGGGHAPTP